MYNFFESIETRFDLEYGYCFGIGDKRLFLTKFYYSEKISVAEFYFNFVEWH